MFGGAETDPQEESRKGEDRNFDLLKYDGVKALRVGRADYAVKCFTEALKISDDLEVRDYLSQAYIRVGELDAALRELKTIAARQPENAGVLLMSAHVAFMQEDYAEQQALCEQVLENEKLKMENEKFATAAEAYHQLGQALRGQGDVVGAVAQLTKAIERSEKGEGRSEKFAATVEGDARLLRGQVLLQMGDTAGAKADCDWLLEHVGAQEDVLLLSARIAHAEGRDDEAIERYNEVNEVNPFQLDAFRERGRIYYERGDKAAAEAEMKQLLELNPGELEGVSGAYEAEGVEQMMKRAYSPINPFGI